MYTDRFTRHPVLVDAALAAGFVVAWSSGFIGATLGTEDAGALTLLMWRFVLATPPLAAWAAFRSGPRLSPGELAAQTVIGLGSQVVYLLGVVLAVDAGVPAGIAALIAAVQPILAAALAGPLLGERVEPAQWLGLTVGLGGVAVVVGGDLDGAAGVTPSAYALPCLGVAGLTAATLLERRLRPAATVGQSLAVQSAGSAVVFTALALAAGSAAPPAYASFWLAVAWVIVLSTVGGYGLYWINAARGGVTRVSSLIYLTPPTTAVWALVMFGQPIGASALLGMAVCLAGVLLARSGGGRRARRPAFRAGPAAGCEKRRAAG